MKPNKDERSLYVKAAQSGAISKMLDRIFKIIVSVTLVGILSVIGFAQYRYQENNREITRQRNIQLSEIRKGNESAKSHIRCAVMLRSTLDENSLTKLQACVNKEMKAKGY